MNVSYRWLQALAPGLRATPEEVAERLTHRGFPVEGDEDLSRGLRDIRVARVASVRTHPNADRLTLCDVDAGGEVLQVVCGAPNVVAGRWYPFAPVGASLPGGMRIRKAKIRGEVSHGMLCSEKELELGPDSDGIMTLDGEFRAGDALVEVLGLEDRRLDVEVTSNRPDLLSHLGLAREVLRPGEGTLELPTIPGETEAQAARVEGLQILEGGTSVEGGGVSIRIEAPERCPRYLGLVVRGVRVAPSPEWLQRRLRAAGARPVNNVVDATNYVLLERGQPLHAFDLERIGGAAVVVRTARERERIRTLDGVDRPLSPGMLAICDAEHPMAVAGVMGGEDSEVTEGTRDVLLECALFTPGPIRETRKTLGLSTDASYRFERGADPAGLVEAVLRCARVVQVVAGGTVEGPLLDAAAERHQTGRVTLRPDRVEALLGIAFPEAEIRALLEPLGFSIDGRDGDALSVGVPGWRSWDVTREVDLIEEIARTHGYDRFPDTLRPYRPGSVPDDPYFALEDGLRTTLAGWGLLEAQTPAFAPSGEGAVEVLNPISNEERWLRSSLLPALLRRVEYNLARGNRDVRIFELGTVFGSGEADGPPRERTHLALTLHGRRAPEHWSEPDRPVDLWEMKGVLASVGARMAPGGFRIEPEDSPVAAAGGDGGDFLPGTSLALWAGSGDGTRLLGRAGIVRPERLDLPRWGGEVWGAEFTLPETIPTPKPWQVRPLPSQPGVERDLALLLEDARPFRDVLELLHARGGELLDDVSVFDLYRGEGVPEGSRSVAVRLHFRAEDRTLTDREVDAVIEDLSRSLKEELGVGIRGG